MREGKPHFEESQLQPEEQEKEKVLDFDIVALSTMPTIDKMVDRLNEINGEHKIDATVLMEFNFNVTEVVKDLGKIAKFSKDSGMDVIMAPDNMRENLSWVDLKRKLQEAKINIEETDLQDGEHPVSVGFFIGKNGFVYAFPKSWGKRPIHKIPGTNVAVTICGEINHIKLEDLDNLEGVNVIYNPAREGDDPYLRYRMLQEFGDEPVTKETVAELLVKNDGFPNPNDSDELIQKDIKKRTKRYYNNLIKVGTPKEEAEAMAKKEGISVESERDERKKFLDSVVQQILGELQSKKVDSPYIEAIRQKLIEKNILVVRSDRKTSGVLNNLPNLKLSNMELEPDYTALHVDLEK